MPPGLQMTIPAKKAAIAASAAAATVLGALYANDRYGFSYDINQLLSERAFRKRLEERIRALGGDVSYYHMLQLADPSAEALWYEGRRWNYAEVIMESSKLATVLQQRGVSSGDIVAVLTTNSPEMVFTLAAVSKLGAVPALVNTALQRQTLQHCLDIANPKLLVCTPDLAPVVAELSRSGQPPPTISLSLSSFPPLELSAEVRAASAIAQVRYEDLAGVAVTPTPSPKRLLKEVGALVYTSGTSGKPKAVAVKNFLLVLTSTPTTSDLNNSRKYLPLRTYSCLPLFHGTALFVGLYYSTSVSGSLCLARKFSASQFSTQLVESGATRMLYVGELCRYLIAAPPSPNDRAHKCIVALGNGLHEEVWLKFMRRFGIQEIREVYRSTEGIAGFDNYSRSAAGVGMVGFTGVLRRFLEDDVFLVKFDTTTEDIYRDPETGFCVLAKAGEPGEAIGRVRSMEFYNEYHNHPEATKLKIISNVFKKGDLFQRTGDLLVCSSSGWVRFHDRSGDTFRWRGENVSASEVREHIRKLPNVQDCSVYAVKLSAYDGQAGAATINLADPSQELNFAKELYGRLRSSGLTIYQVPRLVRFRSAIETTATFKQSSTAFKALPWNPAAENQKDSIYWLNDDRYERIDLAAWSRIESGKAKL
ncbi:related to acyl-CoA synthetases (AMP-forming)/AMP-acid ligases II [Cephalotrichum gorgonifer]|uniref:Related to acyl-CoA synthetases (AMP-forming)/AMP-acid ligases II n=1 Tax=Cephalotrichum gorgonifer TaxID=2041049 RepID=A0AAE8N4H2_9PEZI|nr:related to acyl-CoA synthetases (AMP-forming)/AMP-acid ligases II [Cephalotrichum gorgonifer]